MLDFLPRPGAKGPTVKRYDFRRPDKFSKDQLRTLHIIHESFARSVSTYVSGYVRTNVEGEVVSVSEATYDEFIRSLTNPTLLAVLRMAPWEGNALLEIPPDLSFVLIDRLLGGPGTLPTRIRELTEIEQTVMGRLLRHMAGALGDAWANLEPLTPQLERIDVNPQFVQLLPPHDMVVVIAIRMRVRGVEGRVNLCIPYASLEPVAPRLSAHYLFGGGQTKETGRHVEELQGRIKSMAVDLGVKLGTTALTVRELLDLAVGDVIRLDSRTDAPLPLRVGDKVKFYGRAGRIGSRLAIEITDVVEAEGEEPHG